MIVAIIQPLQKSNGYQPNHLKKPKGKGYHPTSLQGNTLHFMTSPQRAILPFNLAERRDMDNENQKYSVH
jgi:hypothetical protein